MPDPTRILLQLDDLGYEVVAAEVDGRAIAHAECKATGQGSVENL